MHQRERGALGRDGERPARDALPAREVGAGFGGRRKRAARVALIDDPAARRARTRAEIDQPSAREHHLRIVLDDHEGVARRGEPPEDRVDAVHVARMQPDRGLVEHEERVDEVGAEGGREVDALHLAPGERAPLAVEREVAEADVAQESEAREALREHELRGRVVRPPAQAFKEGEERRGGEQHELVEVEARERPAGGLREGASRRPDDRRRGARLPLKRLPVSGCAHAPGERLGLEARARAGRTRAVGAVAREHHAHVHLVVLRLEPLEEAPDAVPLARPVARPTGLALLDDAARPCGELPVGDVGGDAEAPAGAQHVGLAFGEGLGREGLDGVVFERLRAVRDHEVEVGADHAPEAAADRAGADGRIEAEGGGLRVGRAPAAFGAGAPEGVAREARPCAVLPLDPEGGGALAARERRLNGPHRAGALDARGAPAVCGDREEHPVGARFARDDTGEALCGERRLGGLERQRLRHEALEGDRGARLKESARLEAGARVLPDRGGREVGDPRAVLRTEAFGRAREEQLQAVVHLRHRSDGGARRADHRVLVDCDRGRHALDRAHLRAVHAVEELARIGREGLDVAALPLGVERVEDERALARPGEPRHHREGSDGNVEVEVLEVVLLGPADADRGDFRLGGAGLFFLHNLAGL